MTNPKDLIGSKKAPLGLIPPTLEPFIAPAMKNGAERHGPFNWRDQPVQAMIYIEAMKRHVAAWVDGQDYAEDSGVHHIAHAIAGLAILADAIVCDNWIDNRPPPGVTARLLAEQDHSDPPSPRPPLPGQKPLTFGQVARALHTSTVSQCADCKFTIGHALTCPQYP